MALAIVQSTANGHNATDGTTAQVHFGSAPTNGNLLIAVGMMYDGNGVAAAAAGWTIDATVHGNSMYTSVYYKYAGAGESTTQQPDGTGRNYWAYAAWEISGITGTWATDRVGTHLEASPQVYPSSGPYTSASWNTTNNGALVLGGFTGNSGGGNLTITSASYTQDATFTEAGGNLCGSVGIHTVVTTAGTAVSSVISSTVGSNGENAWIELKPAASGTETSVGVMSFSGLAFASVAARTETSTGVLAFQGISYLGAAAVAHSSVGIMSLAGIAIVAAAIDLGAAGTGAVHFSTFGA